jgi:hypothetical protein
MAEIKIRGDVSGSTTIKAPDSGSDEIIELSSALGSKLPFSFGTATPTTTESGFLWYDSTGAPSKPTPKFWDGSAFVPLGGKILQIVRATDTTDRTTTSTSFVDVTGMSVTITPQKSDSAILVLASFAADTFWSTGNEGRGVYQITDNSNNALSGAEATRFGTNGISGTIVVEAHQIMIGRSTPATTSAVTYKLRFRSFSANVQTFCLNSQSTGQMYAIEVSA